MPVHHTSLLAYAIRSVAGCTVKRTPEWERQLRLVLREVVLAFGVGTHVTERRDQLAAVISKAVHETVKVMLSVDEE